MKNDPPRSLEPQVSDARYVAEARTPRAMPPAGRLEIAVAGRSNVGKSTLLNRIAQRKGLARTSKTPGRTRGLVFFDLDVIRDGVRIPLSVVDLPGYGYAQVSKTERQSWQELIEGYANDRETLRLVVVLADARRGFEVEEAQLCEWLASLDKPFQIVFTKSDKLTVTERGRLKAAIRQLPRAPGTGPALLVSGETGENVPALWDVMLAAAGPASSDLPEEEETSP